MEMAGEHPDNVTLALRQMCGVGCASGGSNFASFAYPFPHPNYTNGKSTRIIAVKPASCPCSPAAKSSLTTVP